MKKPGKKQRILDKEVERMRQMVQRREQKLTRARVKLAQAEDRAEKHRERGNKAEPVPDDQTQHGVPEAHPHGV
jgi:hypothetical protein